VRAGRSRRTGVALGAGGSLGARGTGVASGAGGSWRTGVPLTTGLALRTGGSLRARRPGVPLGPGWSRRSGIPVRAGRSGGAGRSFIALRSGRAGVALGSGRSRRTCGSSVALRAGGSGRSGWSRGPGLAPGTRRTGGSPLAPWPGGSGGARRTWFTEPRRRGLREADTDPVARLSAMHGPGDDQRCASSTAQNRPSPRPGRALDETRLAGRQAQLDRSSPEPPATSIDPGGDIDPQPAGAALPAFRGAPQLEPDPAVAADLAAFRDHLQLVGRRCGGRQSCSRGQQTQADDDPPGSKAGSVLRQGFCRYGAPMLGSGPPRHRQGCTEPPTDRLRHAAFARAGAPKPARNLEG